MSINLLEENKKFAKLCKELRQRFALFCLIAGPLYKTLELRRRTEKPKLKNLNLTQGLEASATRRSRATPRRRAKLTVERRGRKMLTKQPPVQRQRNPIPRIRILKKAE